MSKDATGARMLFLGFSGFMCLLLRLINPVVVAPTLAAVGLAFFSYGFPQAGSCVEISIPQIQLILIFTLYLRKISVFGFHIFWICAVPLTGVIVWAYAFLLAAVEHTITKVVVLTYQAQTC